MVSIWKAVLARRRLLYQTKYKNIILEVDWPVVKWWVYGSLGRRHEVERWEKRWPPRPGCGSRLSCDRKGQGNLFRSEPRIPHRKICKGRQQMKMKAAWKKCKVLFPVLNSKYPESIFKSLLPVAVLVRPCWFEFVVQLPHVDKFHVQFFHRPNLVGLALAPLHKNRRLAHECVTLEKTTKVSTIFYIWSQGDEASNKFCIGGPKGKKSWSCFEGKKLLIYLLTHMRVFPFVNVSSVCPIGRSRSGKWLLAKTVGTVRFH